jgi:pimeloyl-ACP methyl ester carboxylesterase
MNGYADDLAAVIEALDVNQVTLLGHSQAEAKLRATLDGTAQSGLPQPS